MKIFIDTEFIEDGRTIDLISLGAVSEFDSRFYAQSCEFDPMKASRWVVENVFHHLHRCGRHGTQTLDAELFAHRGSGACMLGCPWSTRLQMSRDFQRFVAMSVRKEIDPAQDKAEFWGYYSDYDWVAICQLFGTMMDLPKGFPMYCRDVKQFCDDLGNPALPEQPSNSHHALEDARWTRTAWRYLEALNVGRRLAKENA